MSEISVVIPIRNSSSTLRRCFNSIIAQSYSDWEALCVYDSSEDDSQKIIEEYCQRDIRFKFVHGRNKLLAGARNDGIKNSSGKYVFFLDADDVFLPNAFERCLDEFLRRSCDIVVFGTEIVPETPKAPNWYYESLITPDTFYAEFSPRALFLEKSARPFVWRNAYKKNFLTENNLFFDESCAVGEDQVFQLCAFPHAKNGISFISDKLYQYTWHRKGSLMEEYSKDIVFRLRGHIQMVDSVFRYWDSKNFDKLTRISIAIWALYFLGSEIPYLDNEKINLLSEDIGRLFETQYLAEKQLRSLPNICRKKAHLLKDCSTCVKTRLDLLWETLWWEWYWGGIKNVTCHFFYRLFVFSQKSIKQVVLKVWRNIA